MILATITHQSSSRVFSDWTRAAVRWSCQRVLRAREWKSTTRSGQDKEEELKERMVRLQPLSYDGCEKVSLLCELLNPGALPLPWGFSTSSQLQLIADELVIAKIPSFSTAMAFDG